jgi:hypothetical protein
MPGDLWLLLSAPARQLLLPADPVKDTLVRTWAATTRRVSVERVGQALDEKGSVWVSV